MSLLPKDVSRCSNDVCGLKNICKRHLALLDDKDVVPVSLFDGAGCQFFIETEMGVGSIWVCNQKHNIKPADTIRSTRRLTSFSVFFLVRNALVRAQGGWYWITPEGRMQFVDRCLSDITFKQIFDINKKELIETHNNETTKS
jgi:hypothetical protein